MFNIDKSCRLCGVPAWDFPHQATFKFYKALTTYSVGGKRLYYFVANLFKILRTKFYYYYYYYYYYAVDDAR